MSQSVGRYLSLSLPGRLADDLASFARVAPVQTLRRCMNLATLRDARIAASPRPTWAALWTKAFALVSARRPELRRVFLPFPWARVYEHPEPVAAIAVEHSLPDASIWDLMPLNSPDRMSISEIDRQLRKWQSHLPEDGALGRMAEMARLPQPLRRLIWWSRLHCSGPQRVGLLGTFAVSAADHMLGEMPIWSLLTPTLYRGGFNPHGLMQVRLTFDSRAIDARTARWALMDLEQVLNGEIVNELGYLRRLAA
jgi:hypothetical protein